MENQVFVFAKTKPASVTVQVGLCWTRSETLKSGFLVSRLIYFRTIKMDYII